MPESPLKQSPVPAGRSGRPALPRRSQRGRVPLHDHAGVGRPRPSAVGALGRWAAYGAMGVPLFFVISGFVVLMTAWGRDVPHFVASRVGRLFPAYWAAVVIAGVIAYVPLARRVDREGARADQGWAPSSTSRCCRAPWAVRTSTVPSGPCGPRPGSTCSSPCSSSSASPGGGCSRSQPYGRCLGAGRRAARATSAAEHAADRRLRPLLRRRNAALPHLPGRPRHRHVAPGRGAEPLRAPTSLSATTRWRSPQADDVAGLARPWSALISVRLLRPGRARHR